MKKIKWLRKLPVLVLALTLALSPLFLAAPVHANVLNGSVSESYCIPYYGYFVPVEMTTFTAASASRYIVVLSGNVLHLFYVYNLSDVLSASVDSSDVLTISDGPGFYTLFHYTSFFDGTFESVSWGNFSLISQFSFSDNYQILCLGTNVDIDFTTDFIFDAILVSTRSDGILSVFSGVGSWLSGAIQSASTMFWTAESGMTVLGYLAVASLALAVILLLLYLIAGWLKFR